MRRPFLGVFTNEILFEEETRILMKLLYANGVDAVCFSVSDVRFDEDLVNAQVLRDGEFFREEVRLPEFIECNALSLKNRNKLSTKCGIIDGYKLSKKDVNDLLLATEFAPCVIPTQHTAKAANILSFALVWNEVIVKPLVGARGEGINSVKVSQDGFFKITDTEGFSKTLGYDEALTELEEIYGSLTVIVQPRMKFLNAEDRIMDFRLNVEKNGEGKWETIFMIARTSRDSIVSNFSAGGYASLLDVTLLKDYGENADKVKASLQKIAEEIPCIIEEASECNMLSLGIDVGIDRDTLQAYIIEVNYVPKLTFPDKSKYIYTKAEYFTYLYKNRNK